MNRILLLFFIVFSLTAAERVGVINMNRLFYFHPHVLLYYYPEYNSFMKPVAGTLTADSFEKTRKERQIAAKRAEAGAVKKLEELEKKLTEHKELLRRAESMIGSVKSTLWEQQQKKISSVRPEDLIKSNISFHQEMSRALKPHEDKKNEIENKISQMEKEIEEIRKSVFYVEFENKEETEKRKQEIVKEIKETVAKIAAAKKIGIVLNSAVWDHSYRLAESDSDRLKGKAVYERTSALLSGEFPGENESPSVHKDSFALSFLSSILTQRDSPLGNEEFNGLIAGEYENLTVDVITELLKKSAINEKFRDAIISYLKKQ